MSKIRYVMCDNGYDQKVVGAVLDEKLVGYARYKIENREAWLYNIKVNEEFRHLKDEKIGSHLLQIVENECIARWVDHIEGKYYPETEDAIVRSFYAKNGFEVVRDDYDLIIWKTLFRDKKHNLDVQVEDIDYSQYQSYEGEDKEDEM